MPRQSGELILYAFLFVIRFPIYSIGVSNTQIMRSRRDFVITDLVLKARK
jgi:hypothetical protein